MQMGSVLRASLLVANLPVEMPRKLKNPRAVSVDDPLSEETLGRRIEALRLSRGLTKSAFQRALGLSYTTPFDWEQKGVIPAHESFDRLSEFFGVPRRELHYGRTAEADAEDEPPYAAWPEFVGTPAYQLCEPWMVREIKRLRWPSGLVPTVTTYTQVAVAFMSTEGNPE